jgi:hypothetical protein
MERKAALGSVSRVCRLEPVSTLEGRNSLLVKKRFILKGATFVVAGTGEQDVYALLETNAFLALA